MAERVGISSSEVQRIWAARGLKPHLVDTFKLSNDPAFETKLTDVVGLYLNPPEQAIVLCIDEKSQIQALDRTQPPLPIKKGRVSPAGFECRVRSTTSSIVACGIDALRPRPGRTCPNLARPSSANRSRHARTVFGVADSADAIAVLATPSAAISKARARCTSRCWAELDRASTSSDSR